MTGAATATVETLTAEVRVLMVGNRQVTLSVFKQLDWVMWPDIADGHPMGRVCPGYANDDEYTVHLIGKHFANGSLVRTTVKHPIFTYQHDQYWPEGLTREQERQLWGHFKAYPLIVLAGLR